MTGLATPLGCVLVGSILVAPALGQTPPPPPAPHEKREEPPVKAEAYLDVDTIRPGDSFRVAVVFTIQKRFHIYGADQKGDDVFRTRVKPPKDSGIEWKEPSYPKSVEKALAGETFRLYEGQAKVIVKGKAGDAIEPGARELRFEVTFQACTDEYCLPPTLKQAVVLKATIGKSGDPVKPANAEIFAEKKPDAPAPKDG